MFYVQHFSFIFTYKVGNWIITFKGLRSYFSKFSLVFHLRDHHNKNVNLKFQLNWSNHFDVVSNFVYCSCLYNYHVNFIMVTITRHFFINIFQTYQFSAVKFYMRYEKHMSFPAIPKSLEVRKKLKR